MSDLQRDIEEQELTIKEGKLLIAKRDRVIKLSQNKDFQEVIENLYMEGEAVRLAHLSSDPVVMNNPELSRSVQTDLMSLGALRRFLSTTIIMGNTAEHAMMNDQETLDQLRYEESNPDEVEV